MKTIWSNLIRGKFSDATGDEGKLKLLQNIPLFDDLANKELQQITPLLYERQYQPGERIFSRGDPASGVFLIREGTVRVFIDEQEEGTREISVLEEGSFLGELALCAQHRRSASAEAVNSVELQVMFRQEVMEFIHREPPIGIKLLLNLAEVVGEKLDDLNDEVMELEQQLRSAEQSLEELREEGETADG